MAVNRHKNHLVVYLEDKPYREILNGAKSLPRVNEQVLDVKNPCGGWPKVFAELEENLPLIARNTFMHALLLMDFDHQFEARCTKFHELCTDHPGANRIFLLGIDQKESEDLKKTLRKSHHEDVGKILLADCPHDPVAQAWHNHHLRQNLPEIRRMRDAGIWQWLFNA